MDVFFIHPTTFDGGKDWNGPIGDRKAAALFTNVMAPNYAAPFASIGRVFAPRYRQASLYTSLTLFDDALEAREFAYGDVRAAFDKYQRDFSKGRPFIIVGVEQGGVLASRLLSEVIAPDTDLRRRLVAAYLQETAVPADEFGPRSAIPACARRDEAGCVLAWISIRRGDFPRRLRILHRTVVWNDRGRLVGLGEREPLCVNPLLGAIGGMEAPPRLNLGAANATGLEWGATPGFMTRQVGAACIGGILSVTRPRSASLRPSGDWPARLRAAPYNLFYADIEADARARTAAWGSCQPASLIEESGLQSKSSRRIFRACPLSDARSGIAVEDQASVVRRRPDQIAMGDRIGQAIGRKATLFEAQRIASTTQLQIHLGDQEAVVALAQNFQPARGDVGKGRVVEKNAAALGRPTTDPTSQLMKLRQAESLGLLDDHDARRRNVDARPRRPWWWRRARRSAPRRNRPSPRPSPPAGRAAVDQSDTAMPRAWVRARDARISAADRGRRVPGSPRPADRSR